MIKAVEVWFAKEYKSSFIVINYFDFQILFASLVNQTFFNTSLQVKRYLANSHYILAAETSKGSPGFLKLNDKLNNLNFSKSVQL